MKNIDLSFIIPAKNEEGSVLNLYSELVTEVEKLGKTFEVIFIDDGSTDNTLEVLKKIYKKDKRVKVVVHRGNWGKAAALQNGFKQAKGKIFFTLDADLQDNPSDISKFLKKLDEGNDLVVGWKKVRHDPFSKIISSRLFNFAVSTFTHTHLHDINCGFKAFRSEVVDNIDIYGELFRFFPILAVKQNYKTDEVVVHHRPRKHGKSKFGIERSTKGLLDLVTIIFLTGYTERPGHFFGSLGLISFVVGFVIGCYILYLRITTGTIQYRHPLLFLGMLLMIIGVQLVSTGLLAEMLTSHYQKTKNSTKYIREKLV